LPFEILVIGSLVQWFIGIAYISPQYCLYAINAQTSTNELMNQ